MSAALVEPTTLPEIPGYRLLARLGRGGMGEVYLAEELGIGRRVALKRIAAEPSLDRQEPRERFRREARTMAQVSHPHIVQIHRRGEHEGRDFLVMELAEGGTLADRIGARGPLPVAEALAILRQVGEGLAAAWQQGIVHRDVKPANILFDLDGNAKVADFGLAKAAHGPGSPQVTEPGLVVGTPYYLSPEQAGDGEVSFASDIYSLGIVLYEMLAGRPPCDGDSYFKVIQRHLDGKLPDLAAARPGIPSAVNDLYRWMTRRDPAARPRSYAELLAMVDRLRDSSATAEVRSGGGATEPRSRGARWAVGTLLAATALAGGMILAWWWNGRPSGRPAEPFQSSSGSSSEVVPAAPSLPSEPPPPMPPPAPKVPPPEDVRELMSFRTDRFGLELEMVPGPPIRFTARTGRTAYLTLFTLDAPGDLVHLHPDPSERPGGGGPSTPGHPLLLEEAPDARPDWVFVIATPRPLAPPILLGALPVGRSIVYPHRIEGKAAAFPARGYLLRLVSSLRDAGADRDVLAYPLKSITRSEERRAP